MTTDQNKGEMLTEQEIEAIRKRVRHALAEKGAVSRLGLACYVLREDIPCLLAHIEAQQKRIDYLVPVAGMALAVRHSAGDFRDAGEWVEVDHGDLVQLRDYLLDDMEQYELVNKWLTEPAQTKEDQP